MHHLASDRLVSMRPPNSADDVVAAGRFTHVFKTGDANTLCGVEISTLFWRELVGELWDDLSPMLQCRRCVTVLVAR